MLRGLFEKHPRRQNEANPSQNQGHEQFRSDFNQGKIYGNHGFVRQTVKDLVVGYGQDHALNFFIVNREAHEADKSCENRP